MGRDPIEYSEVVSGAQGNYGWPIRMDEMDGYLGVNQEKDGRGTERVLLSPGQVEALIAFYRKWHPAKNRRGAHA